jgi:hypothetical protein
VSEPTQDLLSIAEELYGLPLAEFTPARDARAKELKGTPLAAQVKALKKPSVAAWVANLLVRHDTEQVDQVLAVGAALREAQASMSGDELRALTKQRRQLTSAVTTGARRIAREAGTKVTEAVAEQVEATLTAAMVDEQCAQALRSGLLVAALSATGVDAADVAAAVAVPEALGFAASPVEAVAPARPELHVVPDPEADAKAVAAAEAALEAAEEALAEASDAHEEAADAVATLEARSLQIQSEMAELRAKLDELDAAAEETADELADAEESRDETESALSAATKARDAAAAALEKLR